MQPGTFAPLQQAPVIVRGSAGPRAGLARWGFQPPWLRGDDPGMAARLYNARIETAAEKPVFRDAWARNRRCIVPASGFYEGREGRLFARQGDVPFGMAGLWGKNGNMVSFTVLTCEAKGTVREVHHRMPVLLGPEACAAWLAHGARDAYMPDLQMRGGSNGGDLFAAASG